jgi:hypothetical protein
MKVELLVLSSNRCPVEEFLSALAEKDLAKVAALIELLKETGTLPFPHARKLHGAKGLWEMRVNSSGRAIRIFYVYRERDQAVLISGFIKKSQKTPNREIDRALILIKKTGLSL